ncbi:MAG: S-layer homology domain-containing protein [Bacillota bacterium]
MFKKITAAMLCTVFLFAVGAGGVFAAEHEIDWEIVDSEDAPQEVQTWLQSNVEERGVYLLGAGDVCYLLISWGEKPTGGYVLDVEDVGWHLEENVRVNVNLSEPDPDDVVTQALTYPHALLALENGDETVMVNFTGADWLEGEVAEVSEDDPSIVLRALTGEEEVAPNPLRVEGRARVFEATFQVVVEDGHYHLSADTLTAAVAGPEWAEFALVIPYAAPTNPSGMLIGSYTDAQSGDLVEEAQVPLSFGNASEPLDDIRGHWAEASIRLGVSAGFIDGYPEGDFRPENRVTRAEFLKMLVASQTDREDESDASVPFEDVLGHWVEPYMRWAVQEGWVPEGEFGDAFSPNSVITREEMALLSAMAAGLSASEEAPDFADAEDIDEGIAGWVQAASEEGLLVGYPDGTFAPKSGLKRSEAVTVVWRAVRHLDE